MRRWLKLFVLLPLLLFACTLTAPIQPTPSVRDEVAVAINAALESAEHTRDLWETLLFGEVKVTCDTYLNIPPRFATTTSTESDTTEIILHLNEGISTLQQIEQIWENECLNPREQIPVEVFRQVEMLLQVADQQLYQAALLWNLGQQP